MIKLIAMRKKHLIAFAWVFIFVSSVDAQETTTKKVNEIIPYAGVMAGGCDVSNPFSFVAGIQQIKTTHFSVAYDIQYYNTDYECYCDDTYSKGHFRVVTPSVKVVYNTGKKAGNGFVAGAGIGYMFAKDRGTEQTYTEDALTGEMAVGKDITNGRWDFNSIAPSITLGAGFRVLHFPITISNTYYFAKTTDGWGAVTGGIGIKVGFKRL
jgi:hypothetical protein